MSEAPSVAPAPKGGFYLPALDGIRGFAFLLIFALHALVSLLPVLGSFREASPIFAALLEIGREGVPLFFVLSAYLVTTILLGERKATGRIDVRAFLVRRALRLLPLYYLLLLVTAPLFAARTPGYPWYLLLSGDLFHMIHGASFTGGALVFLWSIGVEEKFYLVWSATLARLSPRHVVAVAVGVIVFAWIYRLALSPFVPRQVMLYGPLGYLDCFGLGILVAVGRLSPPRLFGRPVSGFAALGLYLSGLLIVKTFGWTVLATIPIRDFGEAVASGFTALLSAGLILAVKDDVRGWAVWPPLRRVGKVSYGAYLFHTIVLVSLARLPIPPASPIGLLTKIVALAITLGLALLSFRYIESPFLRLQSRFRRSAPEVAEPTAPRGR